MHNFPRYDRSYECKIKGIYEKIARVINLDVIFND